MSLLLDGVLALGQGVPQLDGLVPGAGDDLTVVGREGHRHDVLEEMREGTFEQFALVYVSTLHFSEQC